ncbi:MAG: heme-copper oxidase subunit III [Chloroflexi bacterium]|nr:heme-copper oxidase subunit III [Chloroflexota bacterium]
MATHLEKLDDYKFKLANNRMGLWLFIFSDAFLFGGLLVTRYSLMGFTRPNLNQNLGLFITMLLLLSSFFMNRAEEQIAHGDQKGFVRNTLITLILGTIFLIGVVGVEWPAAAAEGLVPSAGAAGAVFYVMTGFHAFHVFTGLILLYIVWNNGRKGLYSEERHWAVEACAVYWHFIDVAWIFFYPSLYLIGLVV